MDALAQKNMGCSHGGKKILESVTSFRLVYMQKFRSG